MRIIGIDPGSNTLGVAVYDVDDFFTIRSIRTYVIDITMYKESGKYGRLAGKVYFIRKILMNIFKDGVDALSLESPFIYSTRPAAVIPLSAIKGIVEESALNTNRYAYLTSITPSEVKKSIGVHGNSSEKIDMMYALLDIKEISDELPIKDLADHEWDAIAIGYDLLNDIRDNPYIVL